MKLPWQKGEQRSVSSVMVALSQLGSARWGARSGEALMRDGYLRNAAASVPFTVRHDAAAALLERPLPDETCTDIFTKLFPALWQN